MTKKVTGILLLLFYVVTTTYGQTSPSKSDQTGSTTVSIKRNNDQEEKLRLKLGTDVLFLRNSMINEALQTQSFLVPNLALEVKGKRFGLYLKLGGFNAKSTLDTTIYNTNEGSLTQLFANLGLLQTLPINNHISFRGTAGLGYMVNNMSGFNSSDDGGLNIDVSVGLEFHTFPMLSYFVDLGYRHYRQPEFGQLGGLTLSFGFIIGSKPQ